MLKAVLFDMDGVIVDTEPLHNKAYHHMFNAINIKVQDSLYQSFTGQSTLNICKRLVTLFDLNETPENLVRIKRKHFRHLFDNDPELTLIDGVLDRIKDYHTNGIKLVVASSASMPNIERIFNRFHLNPFFTDKFSGADLKQSKPHPEIFLKAAAATGFTTKECMVIEDSTNGIKAAYDAGIYCVGFKSPHSVNQDYSLANKVISDFKEVAYAESNKFFKH